jgi:hypothetical protein
MAPFAAFEPQHTNARDTVFVEPFPEAGRHRAEVFADHN